MSRKYLLFMAFISILNADIDRGYYIYKKSCQVCHINLCELSEINTYEDWKEALQHNGRLLSDRHLNSEIIRSKVKKQQENKWIPKGTLGDMHVYFKNQKSLNVFKGKETFYKDHIFDIFSLIERLKYKYSLKKCNEDISIAEHKSQQVLKVFKNKYSKKIFFAYKFKMAKSVPKYVELYISKKILEKLNLYFEENFTCHVKKLDDRKLVFNVVSKVTLEIVEKFYVKSVDENLKSQNNVMTMNEVDLRKLLLWLDNKYDPVLQK